MTADNRFDELLSEHIPKAFIEKIPYAFAKKHFLIPIEERGAHLIVAIADPLNIDALDDLRLMLDRKIKAVHASQEKILALINECYNHEKGATSKFIAGLEKEKQKESDDEIESYDLLEIKEEAPIIRLLNLILSEAIHQRASDIHFEPFENDLKIRYRIDGILQLRDAPRHDYQAELLTRIKVLAKLDIAEHRLPQDGRIKLKMGGREIDFRVSTIPVAHGERIVLRILDKENISIGTSSGVSALGMIPSVADQWRRLISFPEGILLVTGPTGSGKTTTLYSTIDEKLNDEINIMTIEDPIEYKLKGIAQMAVHPKIGLTFAQGLRHILRQDPDVVMVGEIHDSVTAEIAIQAALTGHLVLSTLHTNDAPSAITRLVDMGVEPYLLSSTVIGVLAQRLVRKICIHCSEKYTPTDLELKEMDLTREELSSNHLYRGKGCEACFHSGYQGRQGIYELMPIDEVLRSEIAKHCDAAHLRKLAVEQGLLTLREHGKHLVQEGITTTHEIMRVTRRV